MRGAKFLVEDDGYFYPRDGFSSKVNEAIDDIVEFLGYPGRGEYYRALDNGEAQQAFDSLVADLRRQGK